MNIKCPKFSYEDNKSFSTIALDITDPTKFNLFLVPLGETTRKGKDIAHFILNRYRYKCIFKKGHMLSSVVSTGKIRTTMIIKTNIITDITIKPNCLTNHLDFIGEQLSDRNEEVFYYKRILSQTKRTKHQSSTSSL